jgi:hypothetical protein
MRPTTAVPPEAEASAQAQLRQVAEELEAIGFRLQGVRASLPVPSAEAAMLAGELEMDVATAVRSVIECVLNDSILPAIRDLLEAAAYKPDPRQA